MPVDNATVREILEAARDAAAELPEPLQVVGFTKAVDLLAASAGLAPAPPVRQQQQRQQQTQAGGGGDGEDTGTGTGSLEQIAQRIGVDLETVQQVYLVEDGELQVIVPTSRLPSTGARPAMRILIHLAALGRQAGGFDSGPTPIAKVREVCEHYGGRYYDTNNFRNAVNDLRDYIRSTAGRQATLRVLPGGYTEGANLVRRMAGQEQ